MFFKFQLNTVWIGHSCVGFSWTSYIVQWLFVVSAWWKWCLTDISTSHTLEMRSKTTQKEIFQLLWSLSTRNTGSRGLQILQWGVVRRKWLYTDSLRESQHVCGCSKPCFQKRFGKRWMSMRFLKRNIRMHIVLGDHYYRSFRFAVISASIITWLEHPGWRITSNVLSWPTWPGFSLYPIIVCYTLDSHFSILLQFWFLGMIPRCIIPCCCLFTRRGW